MDLLDLLRLLFCCMYPLRRRRGRKARKNMVSWPVRRARRSRAIAMRGPDRHRRIVWLRTRANYADLREKILRGIVCDLSRTVVAWCPRRVVANDFVSSLLHRCGEVQFYVDKWRGSPGLWAGTVVQYATQEEARLALKEVPMQCRHVQIFPLEHILCILVDCELLHGDLGRYSSQVVVSGSRTPDNGAIFSLHLDLSSYGYVEKLFFGYSPYPGIVCRVSYPFVTQAYLAATLLEGSCYDGVTLSATIDATPRDEEIVEDAKKSLMFASEAYFPR